MPDEDTNDEEINQSDEKYQNDLFTLRVKYMLEYLVDNKYLLTSLLLPCWC